MKRVMGSVVATALSASFALADEPTPASAKVGPCKQILSACQAAGYYYGGHKKGPNKGEYKDCMEPILAGQSVAGVTVDPSLIPGCQAARAKHDHKRAAGKKAAPPMAPQTPQ